jgi:hypothetical protein
MAACMILCYDSILCPNKKQESTNQKYGSKYINQKYMQGRKTDKRTEGSQSMSEITCKKNLKCSINRTWEGVSPMLIQTSACIYFYYYKLKTQLSQYGYEILFLSVLPEDGHEPSYIY